MNKQAIVALITALAMNGGELSADFSGLVGAFTRLIHDNPKATAEEIHAVVTSALTDAKATDAAVEAAGA